MPDYVVYTNSPVLRLKICLIFLPLGTQKYCDYKSQKKYVFLLLSARLKNALEICHKVSLSARKCQNWSVNIQHHYSSYEYVSIGKIFHLEDGNSKDLGNVSNTAYLLKCHKPETSSVLATNRCEIFLSSVTEYCQRKSPICCISENTF